MNVTVKEMNRFFMLACAPFLGMMIYLLSTVFTFEQVPFHVTLPSSFTVHNSATAIGQDLQSAKKTAAFTVKSIERVTKLYNQTNKDMNFLVSVSSKQATRPAVIYNQRITSLLGSPTTRYESSRIRIELFQFKEPNYKGYAMKVDLKSPNAMKMVLSKDKLGASETTLAATRRTGAIAGINAGGFADSKGKRYPLGTTMLNGKYIQGFQSTYNDLFFVGLSEQGKLIGGKYGAQSSLDRQNPKFGASFVPILLKGGRMQSIPSQWLTSPRRAPRTIIANYKDDQLIFIVTDGYDEKGRSGATLPELQNKLRTLGVIDAYNLDGGGSSSLIYKNRVINNPSDGELRPLATHFLLFP